jgi:hypothetical protein
VADATRYPVALQRLPASANAGQSRADAWQHAACAVAARLAAARAGLARVAGRVSGRVQRRAAARVARDGDAGEPLAAQRAGLPRVSRFAGVGDVKWFVCSAVHEKVGTTGIRIRGRRCGAEVGWAGAGRVG